MQRDQILLYALNLLEQRGFTLVSLDQLADETATPLAQLRQFWPDSAALHFDCLDYHAKQIDRWRQTFMQDDQLDAQQKLLARYQVLDEQVSQQRYPGCLFIAACHFYPDDAHPIHQLAEQQKQASLAYTLELLSTLEIDNAGMVAEQMELILEGCLSKLLVKHQIRDVHVARGLAEDILRLAVCRKNGALT